MGDAPRSRPVGDIQHLSQQERDEHESTKSAQYGVSPTNMSQANYPYMNQYPQHHGSPARQESFNMNALGGALPLYQDYNVAAQRFHPGSSPSGLAYQMQNVQQYSGSPMGHSGTNSPYANNFNAQYQGQYAPPHTPSPQNLQHINTGGQMYNPGYVGQPQQQGQQFYIQQNQFIPQSPVYPVMPGGVPFGGRGTYTMDPRLQTQQRGRDFSGPTPNFGVSGRSSSIASSSSVVRGPPRKPRQSGHAIWIGNLPPQTDLMSLVLHVCKETKELESLFLISKSNCAFANYKDEETCAAAQAKIHDSRFQTVRLVSRLRRNSVGAAAGASVPTGPADLTLSPNSAIPSSPSKVESEDPKEAVDGPQTESTEDGVAPKDKFFVVKSLTVEDLELSVRNGIWATQSHNEDALNKAYESTENVYLVFSANKSGEYFGYARMISPINNDPAAAIEFAPKAQAVEDPELPKAIPTAATEFAPKGRIIDDSARGTIFWEAERDENDEDTVEEEDEEAANRSEQDDSPPPTKAWGKPFKVEWISTTRLPFYRTRGLRNPWNSNREVKIARDGTELETAIGKRLIGLFHRVPSPVVPQVPGQGAQMIGSYPPQMRFQ